MRIRGIDLRTHVRRLRVLTGVSAVLLALSINIAWHVTIDRSIPNRPLYRVDYGRIVLFAGPHILRFGQWSAGVDIQPDEAWSWDRPGVYRAGRPGDEYDPYRCWWTNDQRPILVPARFPQRAPTR